MSASAEYEVVAWMRMKGGFVRSMANAAAHAARYSDRMREYGRRAQQFGGAMMRSVSSQISAWTRLGATISGVMGIVAGAATVATGLKFNRTMEDSRLQVASMYQMFDFMSDSVGVASGKMTQWQANLGAAKATMSELYDVAKKSPATFRQVSQLYQNAAAGLATQTEDLARHVGFMKKASLLGGLAGGDYEVLGAQVGRIIGGSAGAEMTIWKVLQKPILEAGKKMKVFNGQLQIGGDLTQKFNELTGDNRLKVMMTAMDKIGPDVAKSFAQSMAGITSTTLSAYEQISGKLTAPLYEGFRKFLVRINDKGGLLSDENIRKFEGAAAFFGTAMSNASMRLLGAIERGAQMFADHWQNITNGAYHAFQIGSALIKGAFAYGLTKMLAGASVWAAGAAVRGAGMAGKYGSKGAAAYQMLSRRYHTGMVRGAKGKGGGVSGILGKLAIGIGKIFGKSDAYGKYSRGFMATTLKIGAMTASALSLAAVVGVAAAALGAFGVAIAAVSAYVISNWQAIRDSIVKGLRDGTITLKPLIQSAYLLWYRLVAVGKALVGGATGADMFRAAISAGVWVLDAATTAVSVFMKMLGFFLKVWGGLKFAFQGVLALVLELIKASSYLPGGPSDDTVARAQRNYNEYQKGVFSTMATADKVFAAADALERVNLKDLDMGKIDAESKAMAESLASFLEKIGGDKKGPKGPKGPSVHVAKVEVNWDLRGEDPDRLMTAFMEPLERLADRRVQAYDVIEGGA